MAYSKYNRIGYSKKEEPKTYKQRRGKLAPLMTEEQKQDMESGEWIWAKGAADMKGGLAIHMVLMEEFSRQALAGELEGSVLFMAVPDEESYSCGMRAASELFA